MPDCTVKSVPRLVLVFIALQLLAPVFRSRAADATASRQTFNVPMRDGVLLSIDVYLPSTHGSFPVVLARTPYNKRGIGNLGADASRRGYALAVQDVRGRYESEGENLPFDRDMDDGFDTAEWVAKQSWCNGSIGTWGGSAGAITQLQLGASGSKRITCMHMTVGAPSQYHDLTYTGGVFRKSLVEDWIRATKFASNALPRWVEHPVYDDYWKGRDAGLRYGKVNSPAIHIGGYWDIFAQGTIDAFLGYQNHGGSKARGQQKLILGPWTHGVLQEKAGELKFRDAKNPPGNVQDAWRWYDHWLKGESNGVDHLPAVAYYVIGDVKDPSAPGNVWRTANSWPPVPTKAERWYLHADRTFSRAIPGKSDALSFTYDPSKPAPTVGGIQLTLPAGPMDQAAVESRPDVLVFTAAALAEPLEVTGRVRAKLWIRSDAPDTDFFVTLCDVYPDGKSYNLCEGRLRTRFREGFERQNVMQSGKVYPIDVDLWSTSVIFNRGHRIRVHVTSSSAPGFDPNPNTGERFRSSSNTRLAKNSVLVDSTHPSQLILPVAVRR